LQQASDRRALLSDRLEKATAVTVDTQAQLPLLPAKASSGRALLSVPLVKPEIVTAAKAELPVLLEEVPSNQDLLSAPLVEAISIISDKARLPVKASSGRGMLSAPLEMAATATVGTKARLPDVHGLQRPVDFLRLLS
jgi:hypothetical protein